MSARSFNCIFCTETFESREDLQVHFRKHGDPNLHQRLKTAKKRQGAPAGAAGPQAAAANVEEIGCDACEEKFSTVGKAITHKHKFHPDYSRKHFCAWCGKLFPIKHLAEKHKSAHVPTPPPAEVFRCDDCCFDFYTQTASSFHNRSYHRLDAPAPHLAGSKKYRYVNKELVQIFFCMLCGGEYINNFNLQKHVTEQHTLEEWTEPGGDILRCPRCEAVFHTQAAYIIHLSHHTSADVYVNQEPPPPELPEYTLETLPPIIEKMETASSAELEDILGDLEAAVSEAGSTDSAPAPSDVPKAKAPRKAITLNQFLSMNQDVFGDVFNVQGVEEVPSQLVASQLRPKKRPQPTIRPGTKIMSHNLQKLKDQGVVVQVKNSNKRPMQAGNRLSIANGVAIGKPIKVAQSAMPQIQQRPVQSGQLRPGQPGQPRPGQPGQLRPGQPGQPRPVQPGQPRPGQLRPGQPGQPRPGQPGQPRPGQPGQPRTGQPGQPRPGQPRPVQPSLPRPTLMKVARPPGVRPPGPRPVMGKPAKVNPGPRPTMQIKKDEAALGPFSCFKKPKESLIPISDVPGVAELLAEPSVSAQQQKHGVTSSVLQSRPTVSPQATIVKPAAANASRASPTGDSNKSMSSMEALEKLRKQGLLVKKPKVDKDNCEDSAPDAPCLTVKGGG